MLVTLSKVIHDCITEKDNDVYCFLRIGVFFGTIVVLFASIYAVVKYGFNYGDKFDPANIGNAMRDLVENLSKLLGFGSISAAVKTKLGGDSSKGTE